jgi:mannitol-1-phosphate 5-dehydrogenase
MKTVNKKIVIFGGGKIGRSFIGQLFSAGGFEVVFVDISLPVINELNIRKSYEVVIKAEVEQIIIVKNVRGVDARDKKRVAEEINDATILAVSVGMNALPHIIPLIAEGLKERYKTDKNKAIDIIIAENMRNAAQYFNDNLKSLLPEDYPLNDLVGLVETSIGKMVPIMPEKIEKEDVLKVFAEPYNTLILDKKAFKNPIPDIKGLSPKDNMKAWVDRKLFVHNLGHAATAYWGFFYDSRFQYVWEALEVPRIFTTVRDTMLQSAALLLKKYPDEFTIEHLTDHVDDLLNRFRNKALGDTIYRVGCDLMRKLGPEDRLAGAIRLAVELNMPYDKILKALIAGCEFRAKDERGEMHPSDIQFTKIHEKGIAEVLKKVCGFNDVNFSQIISEGEQMANKLHLLRDY